MRRFIMSVAAVVVSLAVAGAAQAGKGSKGSSHPTNYSTSHPTTYVTTQKSTYITTQKPTYIKSQTIVPSNYGTLYGTKAKFGFYFQSKYCNFWSYKCYLAKYGCTCFWCPCCNCYYYFCVPDDCYYPVTFCPYKRYCW